MRRLVERARREHEHEIDRQSLPFDAPQRADLRVDVAAEHVDRDAVAQPKAEGARQLGIEGNELRAAIVGRPPLACDDARTLGRRCRIGHATVAIDRPARLRWHLYFADRLAADPGDAPAQRGHLVERTGARHGGNGLLESRDLARLDVDEEEGRRVLGDAPGDLLAQIALDQRRRHQHREAEPQRQHDDGRRRAGTMEIGQRKPQRRVLGFADAGSHGHDTARQQREGDERADRAQHEIGGDAPAVGGEHGEGRQQECRRGDQREVAPGQPAAIDGGAAHQRGRRHGARPDQRQQRKQQRDQQAERGGSGERLGVKRHTRAHGQEIGDQRLGQERYRRADRHPETDADQRQGGELQEIGREDQAFGRTQALQGRDCMEPRGEKARDRVADADAAHEQGGEANQTDELGQPIEPEAEAAARLGEPTHPPAGVGIAVLDRLDHVAIGDAGRQVQAVLPGEQAARLDDPRFGERGEGHQEPRSQARERVQPAIGLALDHTAQLNGRIAHLHALAQRHLHAPQRRLLDHGAPDAVALGEGIAERAAALQLELAVQRVARLDRLELDEGGMTVGLHRARHGAAVDPAHQLALLTQEVGLLGRGLAIEQRDRDVAAQDLARVGAQAFFDGAAEREDGGDGAHAQRQTGDEQAKAAEAAAHFATRQPEGEVHWAASLCGVRSSPTTSPSAIRRMRSQRPARVMSWVIRISVAASARASSNKRSITCLPVAPSRLPVGSSASRSLGRPTKARATATRCCSPPDSCAG